MMKLVAYALIASAFLAGCSAGTEGTTTVEPTKDGAATGTTAQAHPEWEAAGVHVASDNVVRDKDGKAYCTVMNKAVADEASMPKAEHNGVTYIFCCQMCPGKFKSSPDTYAVAKK